MFLALSVYCKLYGLMSMYSDIYFVFVLGRAYVCFLIMARNV